MLLNRVLSVGALCDIRYFPARAHDAAHFFLRHHLQPLGVSAGLDGRVFGQREEGGDHFIRGISFGDQRVARSHSLRGGIVRYLIFSLRGIACGPVFFSHDVDRSRTQLPAPNNIVGERMKYHPLIDKSPQIGLFF